MVLEHFFCVTLFSLFPKVISPVNHKSFSQRVLSNDTVVLYTPPEEHSGSSELEEGVHNLKRAFLLTARDFRPAAIDFYTFDSSACSSEIPLGEHMSLAHAINIYPTMIFYDNGREVSRIEGLTPATGFIDFFAQRLEEVVYMNFLNKDTWHYYTINAQGKIVVVDRNTTYSVGKI